jgi:hypothetical protein
MGVVAAVRVSHFCGTDNAPIDLASPRPTVTVDCGAIADFGNTAANAAALLRRFRWLIAESVGALSELSFDRDDVTEDRGLCIDVGGEEQSAIMASGIVDTTGRPAMTISGAAIRVQELDAVPIAAPWPAGSVAAGGGEMNGVTLDASAEAQAYSYIASASWTHIRS